MTPDNRYIHGKNPTQGFDLNLENTFSQLSNLYKTHWNEKQPAKITYDKNKHYLPSFIFGIENQYLVFYIWKLYSICIL